MQTLNKILIAFDLFILTLLTLLILLSVHDIKNSQEHLISIIEKDNLISNARE